jgi:hypothetical protein
MPSKSAAYWQQGVLAALVAVVVVAFNIWTVQSVTPPAGLFGGEQRDYSNMTMRSFREGHTYLDVTPAPGLLSAKNPYDPATRPPGPVLSDASLYKGHYYIYFGVAPVVTLFLPWRLVTGHELPAPYAALILVNGAFLVSTALWWMLRRRYFPNSSVLALVIGILVIGMGSMTHSVLRRTSIWEPPVAAGYLYAILMLFCLYVGVHRQRKTPWFALAGLCLGLAVGSRPTYVVGLAALAAPLALEWWNSRRDGLFRLLPDRRWWTHAIALGLPFGLIFAALLGYNYARFENPFEFGMRYQLTGTYEAAVRHFSAAYVHFNAYVYYWAPAQWSRYFPFIEPIHMPPAPAGYETCEYVYGILTNIPFAWAALFAPLAMLRRNRDESAPLGSFLSALAALYVSLGVFLLFFVTSAARYMLDFTPALMLLACVGLLSVERLLKGAWMQWLFLSVATAAALFSVFVCTMLNFQLQDILRVLNPPLFKELSHEFDEVTWAIERRAGTQFGPLDLTLRFPSGKSGGTEPIISTGWEFLSDYLYVNYLDSHTLRIGFSHSGYPARWSQPLAVDYGAEHHLRVEMGSLFPPVGHPHFRSWDDIQYGSVCRWLHVGLDGQTVMDGPQEFYDASPESLHIGEELSDTYGGRFTGTISSVARGRYEVSASPRIPCGPVEITLAIPPSAGGRQFPLLTTGSWGNGDALLMRSVQPGVVRFYYDHWGDDLITSGDVTVTGQGEHRIVLSIPALWPADADTASPFAHTLFMSLDGKTIAQQNVPGFPAASQEVFFARNGIGSDLCEPVYPWAIRSIIPNFLSQLPASPQNPMARWMPPEGKGAIQHELAFDWQNPLPPAGPPDLTGEKLVFAALLWVVLMVWILGRLVGLRWESLFGRTISAFRGPAAWTWRHKGWVTLCVLMAVAGTYGWRRRVVYLNSVGPVRMRLKFPTDQLGRQEPILGTGRTGAGTMVYVRYSDRGHIQLNADIWGSLYTSEPIAIKYSEPQDIVINSSGLYSLDHPRVRGWDQEALQLLRDDFFVSIGGRTVLSQNRFAYDSRVSEVTVGENRIQSSFSTPRFTGRIISTERLSFIRELAVTGGQVVHIRFRTNPDEPTDQPLLALGRDGVLGLCFARPLPGHYMSLCYRRPDGTVSESARLPDPGDTVHDLEVVPGYVDGVTPSADVLMTMDGNHVFSPRGLVAYSSCPAILGMDPTASPGIGQFFRGPELDADVKPAPAAPEAAAPSRSLILVVKFPAGQTGSEPIISSGALGAADFLYVTYLAGNRLQFGFDHWGAGGTNGQAVSFDPGHLHRLEVETRSVSPSTVMQTGPVRVKLDGVTVLDAVSANHPHSQAQIFVGSNPIGGSTCGPLFRGEIVDSRPGD